MRQRVILMFALLVMAATAAPTLAACGDEAPVDRSLTYSVLPDDGGILATVSDNRIGKHTVWVVLLDPPKSRDREWFTAVNNGEGGSSVSSASGPLPSGTYSWAVYDAEGVVSGSGADYWTQERRIGEGQVTVP